MKKIIIILISILIIIGGVYLINSKNNTDSSQNTNTNQTTENITVTYIDDNPIKIGIYNTNSSNTKRVLVNEFSSSWKYHTDINTFNVFFTNESEIDNTRIPTCFDKYIANYEEDVSMYRIGYHVSFSTEDGVVNKTIISPTDTEDFYNYLEIYLYDGYHRKPGEWYSHTTEADFTKNTLLTGIKLTAGVEIEKITSDITLTAFSYSINDNEDFDENGNYRGNSKYSVVVKKEI